jgi:hypothetical protein
MENAIWGVADYFKNQYKRPDELDTETMSDSYGISFDRIGKGFNLLLQYGSQVNPESEHTVKTLNDVHILSSSQSIDPNSGFIIETYSFVARNMDEPLTGYKGFFPSVKTGKTGRDPKFIRYEIPLTDLNYEDVSFTNPPRDLANKVKDIMDEISAEDMQMSTYSVTSEIFMPREWNIPVGNAVSRRNLIRKFAGKIQVIIRDALSERASFHPVESFSDSSTSAFVIMIKIE